MTQGEGGGVFAWVNIFAGYVPLASQSPYPIVVDPYLVTFYFYELAHFLD